MPQGRKYPCHCSICEGRKEYTKATLSRHKKADEKRAEEGSDGNSNDGDDESHLGRELSLSSRPRRQRKRAHKIHENVTSDEQIEDMDISSSNTDTRSDPDDGSSDAIIQISENGSNIEPEFEEMLSNSPSDSDDDMYMDAAAQAEWLEHAYSSSDAESDNSIPHGDNVPNLDPHAVFANPLPIPPAEVHSEEEENISNHGNLDDNVQQEPDNDQEEPVLSRIDSIRLVQQFIEDIKKATLENDNLDPTTIENLKNPRIPDINNEEDPIQRLQDPDVKLAVDLYLACASAPQSIYQGVRTALLRRFPDIEILSLYSVKKLVATATGVPAVQDDMCINSCHAYVGPLADRETCLVCDEPRYDPVALAKGKKVARKQMCTLPLGPQLQTLRLTEKGAAAMQYRHQKTQEILEELNHPDFDSQKFVYDDVFSGSDYIKLAQDLDLTGDDTVLSFSIDGAQLYQQKKSDTWIAIWVINDYDPKTRFKKRHILPALVVPGPGKPKILDSFLYRSFHHLSAIQRENNGLGLRCWDALQKKVINSRPVLFSVTADAVGLPELDGRVGHHGAHGCRTGCKMKGRHKPNIGHYFAVHLQPKDFGHVPDCNHEDVDMENLEPPSVARYTEDLQRVVNSHPSTYEQNRKETGISKPSILSGLFPLMVLAVPLCFTVDLMHLLMINIPQLLIGLWQGKMKCDAPDKTETWDWKVLVGQAWKEHGQLVANATKYFPSSFHRPPRNPAEKISSGFKATEYYLYVFGLGPGFFRVLLPHNYWQNFCKLVRVGRILMQRNITGAQAREAHSYAIQFVEEYEDIYYQRRADRLHFCRPALHTLLHCPKEIMRMGPGAYNTQLPMERAIFIFSCGIRLHSDPHANLREIMIHQAQISALANMLDQFDVDEAPPSKHSRKLEENEGYILLHPRDTTCLPIENEAHLEIISEELGLDAVARWGRLRLPNGQIARSVMAESSRSDSRNSRNVKIHTENGNIYGEVQFYFLQKDEDTEQESVASSSRNSIASSDSQSSFSGFALVSVYGPPDEDLLFQSSSTLIACEKRPTHYQIIDIPSITSVISMQPLPKAPGETRDLFFVVEKSGLEDTDLTGMVN